MQGHQQHVQLAGPAGGLLGSILSQSLLDMGLQLFTTILFAAVGALVGFLVQRYLQKKFK